MSAVVERGVRQRTNPRTRLGGRLSWPPAHTLLSPVGDGQDTVEGAVDSGHAYPPGRHWQKSRTFSCWGGLRGCILRRADGFSQDRQDPGR